MKELSIKNYMGYAMFVFFHCCVGGFFALKHDPSVASVLMGMFCFLLILLPFIFIVVMIGLITSD